MNHDENHHEMEHGHDGHEVGKCVVCGKELTERHRMEGEHVHSSMIDDLKKRFWISLILTIPILVLSPTIQELVGFGDSLRFTGDMYLLFVLASLVYFYGGYPFFKGFFSQIKTRNPGMDTLISVALTSAYLYSTAVTFGIAGEVFFWELATLIDIMLLGHWLEMRSVMGASRSLEELVKLMPSHAHMLMSDGTTKDVPLEDLTLGDRVMIKPGEKVPADGEIVGGTTSMDESMLTGESKPVFKETGAEVIDGSINGEGSITVEIRKTGKDSFLSKVIELVEEAQSSKSRTQNLADRFATALTVLALTGGFLTLLTWLWATNFGFEFALERAVTVMVITCPHALGLAVPLVVSVSTALSAKNGLLIRNRASFESSRNIDAVVFDKTGTLTEGRFGITDVVALSPDHDEGDVLNYSASLESYSEHPIAKGFANSPAKTYEVQDFRSIPGKGVQGRINGKLVEVVSPGFLAERSMDVSNEKLDELSLQGKTIVFVVFEGKVIGAVALADVIREESKKAIKKLKEMGIRCIMITGDKKEVAEWVSKEIGLINTTQRCCPMRRQKKFGKSNLKVQLLQ